MVFFSSGGWDLTSDAQQCTLGEDGFITPSVNSLLNVHAWLPDPRGYPLPEFSAQPMVSRWPRQKAQAALPPSDWVHDRTKATEEHTATVKEWFKDQEETAKKMAAKVIENDSPEPPGDRKVAGGEGQDKDASHSDRKVAGGDDREVRTWERIDATPKSVSSLPKVMGQIGRKSFAETRLT